MPLLYHCRTCQHDYGTLHPTGLSACPDCSGPLRRVEASVREVPELVPPVDKTAATNSHCGNCGTVLHILWTCPVCGVATRELTPPRATVPTAHVLRRAFETGYVPSDEPPGFEEYEYARWKANGGQVKPPAVEAAVPPPDPNPPTMDSLAHMVAGIAQHEARTELLGRLLCAALPSCCAMQAQHGLSDEATWKRAVELAQGAAITLESSLPPVPVDRADRLLEEVERLRVALRRNELAAIAALTVSDKVEESCVGEFRVAQVNRLWDALTEIRRVAAVGRA